MDGNLLMELLNLHSNSDLAYGAVQLDPKGNAFCLFALELVLTETPEIRDRGQYSTSCMTVRFCTTQLNTGLLFNHPPMKKSQTKQCFGEWGQVLELCLEQWFLFQLLRLKEHPALGLTLQALTTLVRSRNTERLWTELFPIFVQQRCPDGMRRAVEELHRTCFYHPPCVLWRPTIPASSKFYVTCAVCNVYPICTPVFVCQECSSCQLCVRCFRFHDPCHVLLMTTVDSELFPAPAPNAMVEEDLQPVGVRGNEIHIDQVDEFKVSASDAPMDLGVRDGSSPNEEEIIIEVDVVYSILKFVAGRTMFGQKQYNIRWDAAPKQDGYPHTEWVTREQLLSGGGTWNIGAPYDDVESLTAVLDTIFTPKYISSSVAALSSKKKRKSSREPVSSCTSPPPPQLSASAVQTLNFSPASTNADEETNTSRFSKSKAECDSEVVPPM